MPEIEWDFSKTGQPGQFTGSNRLLGQIRHLLGKGDIDAALDIYKECADDLGVQLVAESSSDSKQMQKNLANLFFRAKDHARAAACCELIGEWGPAARAYEACAQFAEAERCHLKAGDTAKAQAARNKANAQDPGGARKSARRPSSGAPQLAANVLAEAERSASSGQNDAAIQRLTSWLRSAGPIVDEPGARAAYLLGALLEQRGSFADAVRVYEKVVACEPAYADVTERIIRCSMASTTNESDKPKASPARSSWPTGFPERLTPEGDEDEPPPRAVISRRQSVSPSEGSSGGPAPSVVGLAQVVVGSLERPPPRPTGATAPRPSSLAGAFLEVSEPLPPVSEPALEPPKPPARPSVPKVLTQDLQPQAVPQRLSTRPEAAPKSPSPGGEGFDPFASLDRALGLGREADGAAGPAGVADQLRNTPGLVDLSIAELKNLAQLCDPVRYSAGQAIVQEGEPSPGLILVLEGSIEVTPIPPLAAYTVHPGDAALALTLFESGPTSATAIAVEAVRGMLLSRARLSGYLASHDRLALSIYRSLAEHLLAERARRGA